MHFLDARAVRPLGPWSWSAGLELQDPRRGADRCGPESSSVATGLHRACCPGPSPGLFFPSFTRFCLSKEQPGVLSWRGFRIMAITRSTSSSVSARARLVSSRWLSSTPHERILSPQRPGQDGRRCFPTPFRTGAGSLRSALGLPRGRWPPARCGGGLCRRLRRSYSMTHLSCSRGSHAIV